jgi:hypothetical protein
MPGKQIEYSDLKSELTLGEKSELHTAGLRVACLRRVIHPSDSNIVKMSLCHLSVIPGLILPHIFKI